MPLKRIHPDQKAERIQFDDLESSSYLSAKTRLGEPTVRIVLLPPERFGSLRSKSQHCGDRLCLSDVTREEAREILKASVSVRGKTSAARNGRRDLRQKTAGGSKFILPQ